MTVRTVLVCEAQVPFVHGGAEVHVRQLVRELRARGFTAELVSVPFKWYPKEEILPHAAAWRLLELSEANGQPVDPLIASKFPTYFARHPNKVPWLIHQYRAAYELCGTESTPCSHTERDPALGRRHPDPEPPQNPEHEHQPDPEERQQARKIPVAKGVGAVHQRRQRIGQHHRHHERGQYRPQPPQGQCQQRGDGAPRKCAFLSSSQQHK